jgi:hypothetical protein
MHGGAEATSPSPPVRPHERQDLGADGSEAGVDTKKLIGVALGVFVIFFIVTQPSQAADITHNIWHGTVNVAHGVADFVDKL